MAEITIYTVKNCPKCEQLKNAIPDDMTQIADMSNPESLTTLRCQGIFSLSAPILQINDNFFTTDTLFDKDNLNIDLLSKILSEALHDDVKLACNRLREEGWDDSADIVCLLYKHNQLFQKDLKNLKSLNNGLMEQCNSMRKRIPTT